MGWESYDKYLSENCGILSKLLPGDVVLVDMGFNVSDSFGMQQAYLHIPAFTKVVMEVEKTHSIANARIHVERVIGCLRQNFSILQGTLPIGIGYTNKKFSMSQGTVPIYIVIKDQVKNDHLLTVFLECVVLYLMCVIQLYHFIKFLASM